MGAQCALCIGENLSKKVHFAFSLTRLFFLNYSLARFFLNEFSAKVIN